MFSKGRFVYVWEFPRKRRPNGLGPAQIPRARVHRTSRVINPSQRGSDATLLAHKPKHLPEIFSEENDRFPS
jgi:hypothetical protein